MHTDNRRKETMDGNTAAAHVAYALSEVSAIYPITPSSVMAERIDEWASAGRKNIFGEKVRIVEMQSEGGAAGAVHGSLASGALTSTFTASQGLLLMIPNMYKIAGEQLPAVFHVAARAVSTHALSIFGDHSDVMATRQTGFAMLASSNPQESMDLAAVAHLAAIKAHMPFLHFFDGFRTSHEHQKIGVWDYDTLRRMVDKDALRSYKEHALNPVHPHNMGSAEQPEMFFQHTESRNQKYIDTVEVVKEVMDQVNEEIGTDYKPFNYYGAPDAEEIIIAMGAVCETTEEVVDYLNANGRKVGLVKVRLYRPFAPDYLLSVIPETVKTISVLDMTKEPGSNGEPLYLDVLSALNGSKFAGVRVLRGRYGLGSKDTQPGDIAAVYDNMIAASPKEEFTLAINDDVTHLSLERKDIPNVSAEGTFACKFWGLGADGTVGANKNSIDIIGTNTNKYVQAYFQYDSKKSGGVTVSHLRFGDNPIRSEYNVLNADFVACHNAAYVYKYDMVQDVVPGGTFLLNCSWNDEELDKRLPSSMKRYIAENNIHFYTCDAVKIAMEVGLGPRRTNTVLQAAFFKISDIIPIEDAVVYMKDAVKKTYGRKGEDIVKINCDAIDAGVKSVHEVNVPDSWKDAPAEEAAPDVKSSRADVQKYVNTVLRPYNSMKGDEIPVSAFLDTSDGSIPSGTAAYEKRGIAVQVPHWIKENCIQCNQCAFVCPHAVIRPFAMTEDEAAASGAETLDARIDKRYKFTMAVSTFDCTGCGSCVDVCPAKNKALELINFADSRAEEEQEVFDYAVKNVSEKELGSGKDTVTSVGFKKPLMEFCGACPGCGESPYARLVTQLFGRRMFIANATGCTSIWGCSAPSTPYTVDKEGRGPAWANSLFEDNAEFGLGMEISVKARRQEMKDAVSRLSSKEGFADAANKWLEASEDADAAESAGRVLLKACLAASDDPDAAYVINNKDMLPKPSVWLFGGDGWAYDIGYGGLDHALASGENINVLVFDTEVYSNTGGQASKSTPIGAVAQFAASGKETTKKNLATMAMSYEYVYVAQVAMGANQAQTLKALKEAEAYDGPSLVIAYSPCINHGIRAGMARSMHEAKKAVKAGYWNLFRYDPSKRAAGENPLTIDAKPSASEYREFLMGEVRYRTLMQEDPERAERLFSKAEKFAKKRYEELERSLAYYAPDPEDD